MKSYYKNYVDGQWIDGGSGVISVDNPATGEHLADQACASSEDIDLAVKAAKRVHEANLLSAMRPVDRGRMVKKMGKFLEENASASSITISKFMIKVSIFVVVFVIPYPFVAIPEALFF